MLLLETDQDDTDSEDNHAVLSINTNMSVTEPIIFLRAISTNKLILHGGIIIGVIKEGVLTEADSIITVSIVSICSYITVVVIYFECHCPLPVQGS